MKTIGKGILKKRFYEEIDEEPVSFEEDFEKLRRGMLELYNVANNSQKNEDLFYDVYKAINDRAVEGNLAAQDYLGYLYKTGLGDLVPANYCLSMDWMFMAGSNGNEYTLSRLKIFFTRSMGEIFDMDNYREVLNANDIYDENYEFELGKLLCDAMVDTLGIKMEELAARKPVFQPSTIALAQKYEQARIVATKSVIEYLKKSASL